MNAHKFYTLSHSLFDLEIGVSLLDVYVPTYLYNTPELSTLYVSPRNDIPDYIFQDMKEMLR